MKQTSSSCYSVMISPGKMMIFRLSKTIVFVLFCYGHVVPQETDPVPPDKVEAIGSYIFRYGYGVMGSKLERKTSTSILHCNHFCLKNSKCVSFNYQLTGNTHGSRELSEQGVVSREESDGVLENTPGCIFVQTVRQDLNPRSCLDLLQAGRRYSGIYTLFDDNGSLFPVYCDLTSEPKAAWTLLMSERTPGSHMFQRKPLFQDYPTNNTNPNWSAFRLPLFNMMQLRSRNLQLSDRWTCLSRLRSSKDQRFRFA